MLLLGAGGALPASRMETGHTHPPTDLRPPPSLPFLQIPITGIENLDAGWLSWASNIEMPPVS